MNELLLLLIVSDESTMQQRWRAPELANGFTQDVLLTPHVMSTLIYIIREEYFPAIEMRMQDFQPQAAMNGRHSQCRGDMDQDA
ncbi:hypothetical protein GUJ93_ZPchr0001g29459 [Zizania palustris]|uniref:Uncharacterized protein n=1 Tax=Zizania palustris TaxID=103762 RepID=A0A8J5RRJ7_ZIZPA|nr:hypothetical protein GUJ93_ZPchr0001g29459 [Zizania palustris]